MIEIHTLGWSFDHAIEGAEEPNASIYARVFVDGVEIPGVMRARTMHRNDFAVTVITLMGAVEIINHDKASWDALPKEQP